MLAAVVMTGIGYVVVIGLASASLPTTSSQPEASLDDQSDRPSASSDRPAPDFTLTDLDGNPVSLSHFRGQPVVINFWATWCSPCRTEMPHLIEAYEQEQGEVVFLAISVEEPASAVRRFAEEYDMPFTVLLDEGGKVAADYGVRGIPVTFFVSGDGEIVVRYTGQMSPRTIKEGLRRIR
jgi:DsbE subfamily thiol:disulfide oxidoreductase